MKQKSNLNAYVFKSKNKSMKTQLFQDFDAVSSKQWKQQIQYELKGADYNETLVWKSPEDIQVRPFYHFDENFKKHSSPPRLESLIRCQKIYVADVEKTIEKIKKII